MRRDVFICQQLATQGWSATLVAKNEIATDAPESVCRELVRMADIVLGTPKDAPRTRIKSRRTTYSPKPRPTLPATPPRKRKRRRKATKAAKPTTPRVHKRRKGRRKMSAAAKKAFVARMKAARKR